jgi:protein ImuB
MRLVAARPELKNRPIVLHETIRGARRVVAWGIQRKKEPNGPKSATTDLSSSVGQELPQKHCWSSQQWHPKRKLDRSPFPSGISRGMPLGEAVSLVGPSAGDLHLEEYDPVADREALAALAAWCGRFSPLVGIEDATTPDSLLLDVTGITNFFGGEDSLVDRVVGDFNRRGLTVHPGLADTVGAAWAIAHFGRKAESGKLKADDGKGEGEWRRLDRECSSGDMSSPIADRAGHSSSFPHDQLSALSIVPSGETRSALRPLPVEALRLPGEVVDLLHQLGVYWIGQLERLPRADFASRFGPQLLERLDQAMGQLSEPMPAHHLPPEFEAHRALEHPTAHRKTIEFVLEQLITEVAQKLLHGGRGVVRLTCRFDCGAAGKVDFDVGLFQASASAEHLMGLAQTRLARLLLPGPVSAIHLEAAITAVFRPRQEELFDDGTSAKRGRELAGLMDRLTSRLGRRSVLGVRLVSDAQPELAYRHVPMVDGTLRRYRRGNSSRRDKMAKLPPRPLQLFERPRGLAVVSIAPDGPPLRFQLYGSEHRISQSWGPERIETGWWRGHRIGRDYYRVETTTGRRYWLFRKLHDGRWFMHGRFE